MSAIGIVCEFDPFHNGHKYLIDAVRKDGDTVVCVMSGNFTQRAEPALFDKYYRVCAAIKNGVDVVLELPFVYATATAEIFASNAIDILCSFGCDKIAFGVESGDGELIKQAAQAVISDGFSEKVEKQLANNISFPVARERAFRDYGIDFDLSSPNNILALEYTKRIIAKYPDVEILPVARKSVEHDGKDAVGKFASASLIRDMFRQNRDVHCYVPENAAVLYDECREKGDYSLAERYSICLQAILRNNPDSDDGEIAYMTEELSRRINSALKSSDCLETVYDKAKTKRYTHSRVRRAVLCKAFSVTRSDVEISVPYIRLLGFNKNAQKMLGELSLNSKLPIVSGYRQIVALDNPDARRIAELQMKSADLYSLIIKTPKPCAEEITRPIIKL